MKKTAIAMILAACVSTATSEEIKPTNPAAFSIGLISDRAGESHEDTEVMTRAGLQDAMHKRCLGDQLKKNTSVAKASGLCKKFIADLTKPKKLSALDFMWLEMTIATMTSKDATSADKAAAHLGFVEFISNHR